MLAGAAGQLTEERAQPYVTPSPNGGGGDNTLPVTHSGTSSWYIINTTDLWEAQGGNAPTGSTIQIDGNDANSVYGFTQPTAGTPIPPYYLVPVGTHTFTLQYEDTVYYTATVDCYWRGYPYTGREDAITNLQGSTASPTEFFPEWPNVENAGGTDNTAPYQNSFALNNGYSIVPDDSPATSCVFCVLPGDEPYQTGETTMDTRSEFDWVENYNAIAATSASGSGFTHYGLSGAPTVSEGVDVIGNISRTVRFWRFDYLLPSTWTAPTTLQNNTGAWAAPPVGTGRGIWPVAPGDAGYPGSPTGVFSLTSAEWSAAVKNLSNLLENQGPAVFVWASGTSGGTYGAVEYRLQPTSLGISLKNLLLNATNVALDTRYCTIVEYCPGLFATGDSEPWVVSSTPGGGAPSWLTAQASTYPFFPYGMPLESDNETPNPPFGGGYFRIWQWNGTNWACVTAGAAAAVPGTPTIVNNEIVGDPSYSQYGTTSGCIFGPTLKSNGANLSGTITSGQTAPFTFAVTGIVAATDFLSSDGTVTVDSEQMSYSSFSSSTFHVTARGVNGSSVASHSDGAQVWAMIETNVVSPGINQGADLVTPFAAREWPMVIGPTFASAAAPSPTGS